MTKRILGVLAVLLASVGPGRAQQTYPADPNYGSVNQRAAQYRPLLPPANDYFGYDPPAHAAPAPAQRTTVRRVANAADNPTSYLPRESTPAPAPAPVQSGGSCAAGDGSCAKPTGDGCRSPFGLCFSSCDTGCGPAGHFWFRGEYLLWWIKDSNIPALVTQGPEAGRGVLGSPGTSVVFGGGDVDNEVRSGGRFTLGAWLDDERTFGLEVGYFFLGSRGVGGTFGNDGLPGQPAVSRPFFDVGANAQNAELVALPDVVGGTVRVDSRSSLQGWNPNVLCNLCCDCDYRVDLLAGFRYLQLNEQIGITENLVTLGQSAVPANTRFVVNDRFDADNYFYGGTLGAQAEFRRGNAFVNLLGSVSLGTTHQVVNVRGSTAITQPGQATTTGTGGLLAQNSNIGRRTDDSFTVVPEVGVRVGYQVTDHMRVAVGYSFLYWSDVVRPGDQIDTGVDTRQLPRAGFAGGAPDATRPALDFRNSDFWAQGINFSLELRY